MVSEKEKEEQQQHEGIVWAWAQYGCGSRERFLERGTFGVEVVKKRVSCIEKP